MNDKNRLLPIDPAAWPAELEDAKSAFGTPLNIHSVMAHHPKLLNAWVPLRTHLIKNSSLSLRIKEILILRNAALTDAAYEWAHHVERGRAAGLSDEEIIKLKSGERGGWKAEEAVIIEAVEEAHKSFKLGDDLLGRLGQHYSKEQTLDLLFTLGTYMTLSIVLRTFDVPLEAGFEPPSI